MRCGLPIFSVTSLPKSFGEACDARRPVAVSLANAHPMLCDDATTST